MLLETLKSVEWRLAISNVHSKTIRAIIAHMVDVMMLSAVSSSEMV